MTAQSPALSPNNRSVSRYMSQIEPANIRTNGRRTKIGASLPKTTRASPAIHRCIGT